MGAELPVEDLKIRHRATGLTPPAVSPRHLLAEIFVRQAIQPQVREFWTSHFQDAFSRRFSRKTCCCSPAKNRKNRAIECSNVSGFWLPRLAPAKGAGRPTRFLLAYQLDDSSCTQSRWREASGI